jgi:hypothetical protein
MQTMRSPINRMYTGGKQRTRTPIGNTQQEGVAVSDDFEAHTGAQYMNSNYISS